MVDLIDRHAGAERIADVPDTVGPWVSEFRHQYFALLWIIHIYPVFKTGGIHFQATQGFLHRLLKSATDGHHLTYRLHLCGQARISALEFLKGETWNLGDDIIDGRFEGRRRCATGNIVLQFVQGVTNRELGRDSGNRKTRCLGSQGRGAGHPRVHLNNDQPAGLGILPELHIRTTGFYADLA